MPHSMYISADSRITAFDPSRPQPITGRWREVTREQFEAARAMARPVWTEAGPEEGTAAAQPTAEEIQAAKPGVLKMAENRFLAGIGAAAKALSVDLAALPALTVSALTAAADASGQPEAKIAKWESRLTSLWLDVLYHAGVTQAVYDGLPSQPHQM